MPRNTILLVEDESGVRFGIRKYLAAQGFEILEAESCRAAEELFRASRPDLVLADYLLPDGTGIDLLPRLRLADPGVPVLILTAHASIDLAVRAIKEGAEQFLTKPVELPALLVMIQRLLENQRNRQKQLAGRSRSTREAVDPFLGRSEEIRRLAEAARRVAASDSPVLIEGETGAGKGVLARWLHEHGPRSEEALVDLNCAGLTEEFLESELFGHEKGAFTGAATAKPGLLEVAHRGTVFLDEVGDLSLQVQPKLLKVLEEKRFRRLGDVQDRRVDIRLIAATHQPVAELVRDRRFRSDLYFRISTLPLRMPPLRERVEDILPLAAFLLERLAQDLGRPPGRLSSAAEQAFERYPWPGNIREMRNVLERALLLSDGTMLHLRDLRFDPLSGPQPYAPDTRLTLRELEAQYIEKVLREEGGRVAEAALRLGIPRSSLYQKMKQYGLKSQV
ncbi:MAG TPA: sigma-54 dependent transcriptional regulator [Thermoanaerobaculia bacterium]|nr:sigma-54 dependent transcriptional regulator [Thermoanaerobaculia bacterium]